MHNNSAIKAEYVSIIFPMTGCSTYMYLARDGTILLQHFQIFSIAATDFLDGSPRCVSTCVCSTNFLQLSCLT